MLPCWLTVPWLCFFAEKPQIVRIQSEDFSRLGIYESVVPLESSDDALLSEVTFVKIHPESGDLLVMGTRWNGLLYRFGRDGSYKMTYGGKGEGPGEYNYMTDFVLLPNGNIIVFAFLKTILFTPNGDVLHERKESLKYYQAELVGDKIYVYSEWGRFVQDKPTILLFDQGLEEVGSFHTWDPRWTAFAAPPMRFLTSYRNTLYLIDPYDFKISAFNPDGKLIKTYEFGETDVDFNNLPHNMDNAKGNEIFRRLNRSYVTYPVKGSLFCYHINGISGTKTPCILDIEGNRLVRFEGLSFLYSGETKGFASMDQVVGTYERGLICVIEDPDRLVEAKRHIPAMRDLDLDKVENPVLFFLNLEHALDP